ncbi:MAG: OmpA family protein [Calothrix sp. CSU_2_0]|nr:OmpA family protein [Calothrix sp. CSU_2_0]
MAHVEDKISKFMELGKEQALQLENFVDLLVELDVITPPESCFFNSSQTSQIEDNLVEGEEELLIYEAYLESELHQEVSSDIPLVNYTMISNQVENQEVEISTAGMLFENVVISEKLEQTINNLENVDTITAFEKLQDILVGTELTDLNNLTTTIQNNLTKLEHQIYDPQELINLLLPSISAVLKLKIAESKEEIAEIISPIVDRAIRSRTEEDKSSIGHAIAPAIPLAISQQILVSPEEVSDAFAPTMGRAIQKQIKLEKNIVVDALYPIIGSTISKYMAETIRVINQQVEDALSVKGIKRKICAKLQGVSEAELILKEALPFSTQAIFLIHKESGLIISDIQPQNKQRLEAEMIAGMLTAIRSFANDCIQKSGNISELDAIDYGTSKIILEVAGYCYLAIIVQGEATKDFVIKIRQVLSQIVNDYGDSIEKFDGNPDTIPSQIYTNLSKLENNAFADENQKNKPSPLALLSLSIISTIFIPWGIWQYHSTRIHSLENKTLLALASAPELAVYRLNVQEEKGKLKLIGRVPNQVLRAKAEKIAQETNPKWLINNQILAVEIPPDPVLATAEVQRVTEVLNQIDGVSISSQYLNDKVTIQGTVSRHADAIAINNAFEQIPGVKLVSSAVSIEPLRVDIRFYFESTSANLQPKDLNSKLEQVKFFLNKQPKKYLKIIGYSNSSTGTAEAEKLAIARAETVKQALINRGIDPTRLQTISSTNLPPGINQNQPEWLKRCVVLEPIDN